MAGLLDQLDSEAQNLLLAVARPITHAKGERLVRYGEPSRGAYLLIKGAAEASVLLPGGEKLAVAQIEAGSVFGETALIERGTCTATVTASEKLDGWFIERDDFRALVAQRIPAALRIQHALTLALSQKVRALNAKVLEVPAAEDKPSSRRSGSTNAARLAQAPFELKAFLPHLRAFESFDASEIAELLAVSSLLELPRGDALFIHGQPSAACFIVIRGAIEIIAQHEKRERRMAVLGPGQLIGYMSAIEHGSDGRGNHGSDAVAREHALLLEIPRETFEKIYFGASPASTKLHRLIQKSLLASLGQTNRHLTRLISQARLRGADREGEKLEKAYGGQIIAGPVS